MKTIKVLGTSALTIIIGLIYVASTCQNPVDKQCQQVIKELMTTYSFQSEQEALDAFPELRLIQQELCLVQQWEYELLQQRKSPIAPDEAANSLLLKRIEEIKLQKQRIRKRLTQLQIYTQENTAALDAN